MEWQVQLCELNYDRRELNAVNSVIESGWLTMGPIVAEFEKGMQKFLCAKHQGIAVSSATAGLHLILMNMEVGPGDEVIIGHVLVKGLNYPISPWPHDTF